MVPSDPASPVPPDAAALRQLADRERAPRARGPGEGNPPGHGDPALGKRTIAIIAQFAENLAAPR